jgi:hypothetical protein
MTFRLTPQSLLQAVIYALSSAGAAAFAGAALAANVDYEGESVGPVPPNTDLVFAGPVYVRTTSATEIADGVACAPNCPDNGTKYHLNHQSGFAGLIGFARELNCSPNCDLIDLYKIDVAEANPGSGPVGLTFIPLGVNPPPNFLFTTDGVADGPGGAPDFETVTLPATYRNMEAVAMISTDSGVGFAIDNIIVELEPPVPALGPFGLGMLALSLCISAAWFARAHATVRWRDSRPTA